MTDTTELLRAFPALGGTPARDLAQLQVVRSVHRAGTYLLARGDVPEDVIGLLTGRVKVVTTPEGKRPVGFGVLGPGEIIGLSEAIAEESLRADVISMEPGIALKIRVSSLLALCRRVPDVAAKLFRADARRVVELEDTVISLACDPAEARLARALVRVASKFAGRLGDEIVLSQPLTRQVLAELAGTTVETAIRVVRTWSDAGIVRAQHRRFVICSPADLHRIAGTDLPASCVSRPCPRAGPRCARCARARAQADQARAAEA